MTYNVFSGTLNPTHFTSLHDGPSQRAVMMDRVAKRKDWREIRRWPPRHRVASYSRVVIVDVSYILTPSETWKL